MFPKMRAPLSAVVCIIAVLTCALGEDTLLEFENARADGGYQFYYKTSGGVERSENGVFSADQQLVAVQGLYRHPLGGGGNVLVVEYTADENGYRPKVRFTSPQRLLEEGEGDATDDRILTAAVSSLVGGGLG